MGGVDLSIIIVNWNVVDLLRQCLQSVPGAIGSLASEVIVVDNASSDGSVAMLREEFPQVVTIASSENLGFGRGNNLGIQQAKGAVLALVNPDVVLPPGSLKTLVEFLRARTAVGLVGPTIRFPDGRLQSKPGRFPSLLKDLPGLARFHRHICRLFQGSNTTDASDISCDFVSGACMVFRREALEAIGGVPSLTFMYGEEILIGHRLRQAGYTVRYVPQCEVFHHYAASAIQRWGSRSQVFLQEQMAKIVVRRAVCGAPSFWMWNLMMLGRELVYVVLALLWADSSSRPHLELIKIRLQALYGRELRPSMRA